MKNKYIFIGGLILIIIFSLNYNKEGMTNITSGKMVGYIKRKIHPVTRPIVRKVKSSFENPTFQYYTNKINQLLK